MQQDDPSNPYTASVRGRTARPVANPYNAEREVNRFGSTRGITNYDEQRWEKEWNIGYKNVSCDEKPRY